MNHANSLDKQALMAALELEEKGYTFFKETASKSSNSFAKEVFDFLAGEELRHIQAIKKFNVEFLKGNSIETDGLIEAIKSGKSKSAFERLFKHLSETAPIAGTELDAYKFAMDFELQGEAFYKKAQVETADQNAKKLYGFLVGEERGHFKIVESCLAYFENPSEFFHQREKWHLEG